MFGLKIEKSETSQFGQLYAQLRDKILQGEIPPGAKLSSSRELAKELKISRGIALEVMDQLKIEGFVEAKNGSGTYVLPRLELKGYKPGENASRSGVEQTNAPTALSLIAGVPDWELFPKRAWNDCYKKTVEYAGEKELGYCAPQGRADLREALKEYLFRAKGIRTETGNIFITAGGAQAFSIIGQIRGNAKIILEDPLATFICDILKSRDCECLFAPADEQGIIPESIPDGKADFIYVSPSHQFPLGGYLPASRRVELLGLAKEIGAYVIEDDYDGEYRYDCRPTAALQVLAPDRVIYTGTFSKILSPALRLAYMVVPESLIKRCAEIKSGRDYYNDGLSQAAMARFVNQGYLERHIRKSARAYLNKKKRLEDTIRFLLGPDWKILGNATGLHLVLQKPGYNFNEDFKEEMRQKGFIFRTVGDYCVQNRSHADKLVVGYARRNGEELERAVRALKDLI